MSLYQKYRPKFFDDVLTQHHVINILKYSVKKNEVGHAYLFVGTRGCGKTSIARILARAINCKDIEYLRTNGNPCNSCESCHAALNNSHPDIIEMDAASNRGIEEIRALKDSISFLPSFGGRKVYIIDEVHMMTKEAFNALLKTLEEPPEYVTFILCTTELHKVPLTIVSRSLVFEFKPATDDDLFNKIKYITELENKAIPEEGIKFIVRLAKGSFRDAESILDKVLRVNDTHITYDKLLEILGYSNFELIKTFKDLLYKKDFRGVLDFANKNLNEGNVLSFNYQLCQYIFDDIVENIDDKSLNYKLSLFSLLTSLEKELKSSLVQKSVYIANILKFLIKKTKASNKKKDKKELINSTYDKPLIESIGNENKKEIVQNNHLETHLHDDSSKINVDTSSVSKEKSQEEDVSKVNFTNEEDLKKDFLEFLKSKNLFLHQFFTSLDFNINGNAINVKIRKNSDEFVLKKTELKVIVDQFSQKHGVQLEINLIQQKDIPSIDKKPNLAKKENKEVKKLKDLTDQEIMDIFKN